MREISADELDGLSDDAGAVFGTLVYAPKSHKFHAARKSLRRLGASYDHELRAWRIPICEDVLEPLRRLYRMSSLALYVIEDGDELTAELFERYQP